MKITKKQLREMIREAIASEAFYRGRVEPKEVYFKCKNCGEPNQSDEARETGICDECQEKQEQEDFDRMMLKRDERLSQI